MTNYEKIKAMDIAQMAEFIDDMVSGCDYCPAYTDCLSDPDRPQRCSADIREWLKEESQ